MPRERYYSICEHGEGEAFGSVSVDTSGDHDASFSRHSIRVSNTGVGDYIGTRPFLDNAAPTEIWCHAYAHFTGTNTTSSAQAPWQFYNSSGTLVLRLRPTSTGFTAFVLEAYNGSGYTAITSSFALPTTNFTLDIHIVCGAGGSATIYADKVEVATGSVDANVDNIAEVRHGSPANYYWSQMAGANFDLRDLLIKTLPPTADGANTDAVGTFAEVDENGLNDADLLAFGVAGDTHTMTADDYTLPVGNSIESVWTVPRARGDTLDFQACLRSNAIDYFSSNLGVDSAFAGYPVYWAVDPDSGGAWTETLLNQLEFGAKAV